jgi:hypothetical protein
MVSAFMVQAGKSGGGGTTSSGPFSFTYNVGTTVTNYHVFGLACQVAAVRSRPAGTLQLGQWYVWDLGRVTGSGKVSCPSPMSIKGQTTSVLGILFFADDKDLGGQAFRKPVVDVQIFTPSWYSGYASIEVMPPSDGDADDSGIQLYWGAPFSPFAWDISADVWDVEPSTW